jgi:hypothetical protein
VGVRGARGEETMASRLGQAPFVGVSSRSVRDSSLLGAWWVDCLESGRQLAVWTNMS